MSRISCSICCDCISSESVLLHLDCGHIYHDSCVSEWMQTSKTCPDCRKIITNNPSRVFPHFDDDDGEEILQLVQTIRLLENENKNLEEMETRQSQTIIQQQLSLAGKACEVIHITNAMETLKQVYSATLTKNEELTRTNKEATESLNFCYERMDSLNNLVADQQNENTALTAQIIDLEKQLQVSETDAQMDKYLRSSAMKDKDEMTEQLDDARRQLFYAWDVMDRNFVQIETTLLELERLRTEEQLQALRVKQMERTLCELASKNSEIEQENVQLKQELKKIMSASAVCSSVLPKKRKYCNQFNEDIKEDSISTTKTDDHTINLFIKKVDRDTDFECIQV